MRIKSFEFKDLETGWELEKLEFQRLNLLVGASGVGKSMMLKKLESIIQLNSAHRQNPMEWNIVVEIDSREYMWEGKIDYEDKKNAQEKRREGDLFNIIYENRDDVRFVYEKVQCNGNPIAERRLLENGEVEIYFDDKKTAPLRGNRSLVVTILDDRLDVFKSALSRVLKFSLEDFLDGPMRHKVYRNNRNAPDTASADIINSDPLLVLYTLEAEKDERMDNIINNFKDIFPSVNDVKIKEYDRMGGKVYMLLIEEEGAKTPIPASDISQGMLTTFMHLVALELVPDNSVLIVDEFENSLGVNCLDAVVDLINNNERNIQFILTSHHPYIINNISIKNWKVVLREGSKVRAVDAEELGLGKSKHEAFNQLIATDAFRFGKL